MGYLGFYAKYRVNWLSVPQHFFRCRSQFTRLTNNLLKSGKIRGRTQVLGTWLSSLVKLLHERPNSQHLHFLWHSCSTWLCIVIDCVQINNIVINRNKINKKPIRVREDDVREGIYKVYAKNKCVIIFRFHSSF